jgi:hypothetical protein
VPAPTIPAIRAPAGARCLAAIAPAAAVRTSVSQPLSRCTASSLPVSAESRIIMPETLGRPRFGLSKKPGLTLIAKLARPGT